MEQGKLHTSPFNLAVLVAGLGFFIDAFDLFLFNVYRVPSLQELGFSGTELTHKGEMLLSFQMAGMMLGGIISGILADKKGRAIALYGSIALYSFANIANAFVYDINTYAVIRFLAGLGLAGELGAGVTLVAESMSIERRGYGTILVATLGALGAVSAGLAGDFMPWRYAFFAAGIVGLLILILRMKSMETSFFKEDKNRVSTKGSFRLLFANKKRAFKYLACIMIGIPIWYSVGILITLSPELAKENHLSGIKLSACFILFQVGIASGDLISGILSQVFKSRKKILLSFMLFASLATGFHFFNLSHAGNLILSSFLMGFGCGYLSVFVTSTSEQFGTNLRVTITATVTNFMRGAVVLLIPLHQFIESFFNTNLTQGVAITGIIVWSLALLSIVLIHETFGKNLNFIEE